LHKIGLDGLEVPHVANLQAFNDLAYRFKQTATSKPLYFENHIHLLNKWLVSVWTARYFEESPAGVSEKRFKQCL